MVSSGFLFFFFFFQAEDGIRDHCVTGVQTCALPISDTTAVALAAALGAERCEIYSDVDGVYSADPRVVSDPVHLPQIDLATLQEMAEAGAKVLNAQAVEWARRAKITLHARKTSDPL